MLEKIFPTQSGSLVAISHRVEVPNETAAKLALIGAGIIILFFIIQRLFQSA